MPRNLARLVPLCFLVAACGASTRHQALLERREAIRASNAAFQEEFIRNYRGGDGFQDTRWGMPPEEVQALYPGSRMSSTGGHLRATTVVVDREATADFFFTQGKLAAVSVQFHEPDPLREEFGSLSELLSMKYGEPVSRLDTAADVEARLEWYEADNDRTERNARLRELGTGRRSTQDPVDAEWRQKEEEARLEAIQARNDYTLREEWKDSETQLFLSGQQTPATSNLTLQYLSRHLKPYLREDLLGSEARRKQEQALEL
ncbi:hypothetical protein ACLESO_07090 [Pyxidicoccus sp. 3LG]